MIAWCHSVLMAVQQACTWLHARPSRAALGNQLSMLKLLRAEPEPQCLRCDLDQPSASLNAGCRRCEEVELADGGAASVEGVLQMPKVQQAPVAPLGAATIMAGGRAEEAQAAPEAAVRPAADAEERAATGLASSHAGAPQ